MGMSRKENNQHFSHQVSNKKVPSKYYTSDVNEEALGMAWKGLKDCLEELLGGRGKRVGVTGG